MIRKQLLTLWALFLFASMAIAQDIKPITWKDIPTWKYMPGSAFEISPDGKWTVYGLVQLEGDGEIILQKVGDESSKKTFKIGSTSYPSMQFSEDGKWFVYTEYPTFSEKKANEKSKGKSLKNKAILVKLGTDEKKEFENVSNYAFNGKASSVLAINLSKEGNGDARGSDLLIYHLNSQKAQNLGNVADFSFNKAGNYLAYTVDAANQSGNGLYLMNVAANSMQILDSDKASYRSLAWTEKGDAFAALKMVKDKKYKQDKGQVIGVKNLASPQVTVYNPEKDSINFNQAYTISQNRRPMWSDDLTRLFYGIHPLELAKKEEAKKEVDQDSVKQAEAAAMQKIMADTTIKSISDLQKAIAKLDAGKVKG
ncbi:MAG TPA: S9 family peptidase, partial [Algoriphagus sp.]|nr:S9 family peptidase [Algoriphagus sp.]